MNIIERKNVNKLMNENLLSEEYGKIEQTIAQCLKIRFKTECFSSLLDVKNE